MTTTTPDPAAVEEQAERPVAVQGSWRVQELPDGLRPRTVVAPSLGERLAAGRRMPRRARCGFGNCIVLLDARGRIVGGFGPVVCACDNLPSWRKDRLEQKHRTSISGAVKARGRHGSRVQRARQRHRDVDATGRHLPTLHLFEDGAETS